MIHVGKVKRERVILEKSDSMKKIITEKHKNSPFSHPFSSDPSGHSSIPLQRWLSRIKKPSRSHLINLPLLSWKAEIKRTTKLFNFEIVFLSVFFYIMLLSRAGKMWHVKYFVLAVLHSKIVKTIMWKKYSAHPYTAVLRQETILDWIVHRICLRLWSIMNAFILEYLYRT